MDNMEVDLVVEGLDGSILLSCETTFDVEIAQIKTQIAKAVGCEPNLQRLIFGNCVARAGQRLCEVTDIPVEGRTINAVMLLRSAEEVDGLNRLFIYGSFDDYDFRSHNFSKAGEQWLQDADAELAEIALKRYDNYDRRRTQIFRCLPVDLRGDIRVCLLALEQRWPQNYSPLPYISSDLWSDRTFVFRVLELAIDTSEVWPYLPLELQSDRDIVLKLLARAELVRCERKADVFTEITKHWSCDREIVRMTLQRFGPALQHASAHLRDDCELVLVAMTSSRNWGWYRNWFRYTYQFPLCYASERIRADRETVLQAVQLSAFALQFAHESLQADRKVVECALARPNTSFALQYASEDLRSDWKLLLHVVESGKPVVPYMAPKCWEDPELLSAILVRRPSSAKDMENHFSECVEQAMISAMDSNIAVAKHLSSDCVVSEEMHLALTEANMRNRDAFQSETTLATGRSWAKPCPCGPHTTRISWELEEITFEEELRLEINSDKRWRDRKLSKTWRRNDRLHRRGR